MDNSANLLVVVHTYHEIDKNVLKIRIISAQNAEAFGFHNVSLDLIRRIHRCYGYGQRMDSKDFSYYSDLQHC